MSRWAVLTDHSTGDPLYVNVDAIVSADPVPQNKGGPNTFHFLASASGPDTVVVVESITEVMGFQSNPK